MEELHERYNNVTVPSVSAFSYSSGCELSAENITLVRGGRRLAAGLSLRLAGGEALVVTGPNGAGKSTLLRVLAGLLRPAGGRVAFTDGDDDPSSGHAHYIGHSDALKGSLTAAENLAFWSAMLAKAVPGATPREALTGLAIRQAADLPVAYLSAGQKRRVALARLLVSPRPLWLLDEPMTALDAAAQARLLEMMRRHLGAGGLIVAATHAPLGLPETRELRMGGPGAEKPAPHDVHP
jgi:heme exporter protein A